MRLLHLIPLLLALLAAAASAQETDPLAPERFAFADLDRLAHISIEELMNIQVTSVAGVEEDWFRTPASLYVITNEDVRRTGHQTLPEILRLVPGMHVAHDTSMSWHVEPRGFTGPTIRSNKNLVLIDGRTVWDPLFSGVWWDAHDLVLEDLDRIEVVRGPGATLWGANAINGVINIVSKSAKDTQGLYLTAAAGNYIEALGAIRYGGQINDHTWYRVWGKYRQFDDFETRPPFDAFFGGDDGGDWSMGRGGFRIDGEGADDTTYTLEGELYHSGPHGQRTFSTEYRVAGGHLLGKLTRDYDANAGWSLQAYYDYTLRARAAGFEVDRHTFDVEMRHWFDWAQRQSFIWGLRTNVSSDLTQPGGGASLDPDDRTLYTLSAFAQNTTEIIDDTLFAMVGSKFEYNDYTGFEIQPSARVWWTPNERQMLWGAISRAVRVPSRVEEEGIFASGVTGSDDVDAEVLIAYELGHRIQITDNLKLDTSIYYHDYDKLITLDDPPPAIRLFNNKAFGRSYGLENSVTFRPAENWRLEAGYAFVVVDAEGPGVGFEEDFTPRNQAQIRSFLDITRFLELNAAAYYVDHLDVLDENSHVRLDVGVTWHVNDHVEIAVWGQNLLDPVHSEVGVMEDPRAFYVQATLRY